MTVILRLIKLRFLASYVDLSFIKTFYGFATFWIISIGFSLHGRLLLKSQQLYTEFRLYRKLYLSASSALMPYSKQSSSSSSISRLTF